MSTEDRLAANKAALEETKKKLEELQAEVEKDAIAIRKVQPHLLLLASIESELAMIEATVEANIAARIEPIRMRILDNVREIKNLLVTPEQT